MPPLMPSVIGNVTSYSISPPLPAGLTISATTGQVSGTPTATAGQAVYTVTASNSSGSVNFSLSLKVVALETDTTNIARLVAEKVVINPVITVRPVNFDPGTLYAVASDSSGLIQTSVVVTDKGDGSYSLRLATKANATPKNYSGTVKISVCRDTNCASSSDVANLNLPYAVQVLSALGPWPADNRKELVAWPGVADWSTVQGNAGHTGYVPVKVNPDQFTQRWRAGGYAVSNTYGAIKQNLVTANGLFYVVHGGSSFGPSAGTLYAKRESDNSDAWQYSVEGLQYPQANPAAVANGVVYFAAGQQSETYMFARNATDGGAVYKSRMSSQWESFYAPTIGPNGALYANAGTYGGLYGFDPLGSQLFFSTQSQVTNWSPAVSSAGVYVYTGDKLQVVDPVSGTVTSTVMDAAFQNYVYDAGGTPVLGDAALGSVFGAAYTNSLLNDGGIGNALTNFRTLQRRIAWQIKGVYPTTPGYKNGVIYAVNNNPLRLEARAEADGALLWFWAPDYAGETKFISEVLLTDNMAFISTNYATHAIDLITHRSVWNYPVAGKLALSANGVFYIHNNTELVAFNLK